MRKFFRCCCPLFWLILKKAISRRYPQAAFLFNRSRLNDVEAAENFYRQFQDMYDSELASSNQSGIENQPHPTPNRYRPDANNRQMSNFFRNLDSNRVLFRSLLSDPDENNGIENTNYLSPTDSSAPICFSAAETSVAFVFPKIGRCRKILNVTNSLDRIQTGPTQTVSEEFEMIQMNRDFCRSGVNVIKPFLSEKSLTVKMKFLDG